MPTANTTHTNPLTYRHDQSLNDGNPIGTCLCNVCIRLDWQALDDDRPSLAQYRREARS